MFPYGTYNVFNPNLQDQELKNKKYLFNPT
jgi:hypothetical protein